MNTCFASPDQNGQLDLLNLSGSQEIGLTKDCVLDSRATVAPLQNGGHVPPAQDFDGITYIPEHDQARLGAQLQRVFNVAKTGDWLTLDEICAQTGDHTQAVSARLRDLRKAKFGGHTVDRRRRGAPAFGIFEYRLVLHT